jgi:serine protease AprX
MQIDNAESTAGTTRGRHLTGLFRFPLVAAIACAIAAPGWSQAKHGPKIAPDFAHFPVHSDNTVDVIIQFAQKPLAEHFQMMAAHGGRLKHSFKHLKGAAYRLPVQMLEVLENLPGVAYVAPDRPNKSFSDPDYYREAVMADVAQTQYGLDGTGVGVAIIDSGIYPHPDLQNSSGSSRIVYSQSFVPGEPSANDAYGHGTHVAGIVGGNGSLSNLAYSQNYQGIATNVNLVNLRVLDENGEAADSTVIAAIETAIELKSTYNIRVINLSLGRPVYESYTLDPLCQAVEAAWQAGIVVVAAAGNSGRDNTWGENGYGTVNAPGNDPAVITVGATKTRGTASRSDDTIGSYSSKGPTLLDHIVKPDLVAPGNRIVSLLSPGSTIVTEYPNFALSPANPIVTCVLGTCTTDSSPQYMVLSGTSMATPVVAGTAALMLQQDPTLTPDTVKARMMKTAWKGYPDDSSATDVHGNPYLSQYDIFTVGAGYLDVDAALGSTDEAANAGAPSPTAVFNGDQQVSMVDGTSIVWGHSIVWSSSAVWSDSIVWSPHIVSGPGLWGAHGSAWGDTNNSGNGMIWGSSIVWSGNITPANLNPAEGGEN